MLLAGQLVAAEQETTSQAIQIKALQGISNDLLQRSRFLKMPNPVVFWFWVQLGVFGRALLDRA